MIEGKPEVVRLSLTVLLAEGHLLIEDVPGVGKTMLAKALARSIDCSVRRIQFTPDLLPSDITGVSIFDQQRRDFEFKPGAIFAQIVIGDEINRASPKTQSALLESMEERQVTIDGQTYELPDPFMVVATQNPVEMEGTYPLPEAQRDRFMARVSIGYPSAEAELQMLDVHGGASPLDDLQPVAHAHDIVKLIDAVRSVHVAEAVRRYAVELVAATRQHPDLRLEPRRAPPCTCCGPPRRRPPWPGGTTPCRTTSRPSPSRCSPTVCCRRPRHSSTVVRPSRSCWTSCSGRRSRRRADPPPPPRSPSTGPAAPHTAVSPAYGACDGVRGTRPRGPRRRQRRPAGGSGRADDPGRSFLAAGVAATVCAYVLGQGDLLRVGLLLAVLPLVCVVVLHRTRYRVAGSRRLSPSRVPAGSEARVHLRMDNVSRLHTGLLMLQDRVPYVLGPRPRFVLDRVEPGGVREVSYRVRSDLRGRYPLGPLQLQLGDPFGMCELTRSFSAYDTLVVIPRTEPLPALRLAGEASGYGDGEQRSLALAGEDDIIPRGYRHGDDLRRVHWRSTARYGELMVRREEQPQRARCTVLLDTRRIAYQGAGPGSAFEWAVSGAASALAHMLERGFAVRLLTDEGNAVPGRPPTASPARRRSRRSRRA